MPDTWFSGLTDIVIRPPRRSYELADFGPAEFELEGKVFARVDFKLTNERGHVLECSHFVPKNPPDRPLQSLPCVVYLHGNSSSRIEAYDILAWLLPREISVLCFDFAGSGWSGGEYVSLGHFEQQDLKVIMRYLRENKAASNVGLWGRSMGASTAAMYACEDDSLVACVMDSPYCSFKTLAEDLVNSGPVRLPGFMIRWALQEVRKDVKRRADFDVEDLELEANVRRAVCPAIFACGEADMVVPPHHSERLHKAWGGADKQVLNLPGGHNEMRPEWFLDAASAFLEERLFDDIDASARVTRLERSSILPDDEKRISPPRSSSIGPAARLPPLPTEKRHPEMGSAASVPVPRHCSSSQRMATTSVDRAMEGLANEMGSGVLETHMKRHSVSRPIVVPPSLEHKDGPKQSPKVVVPSAPPPQCRSPPKPSPSSPALLLTGRPGLPLQTLVAPPKGGTATTTAPATAAANTATSNSAGSIKGSSSVSTAAPSSVTLSPRRLVPCASAPRPFAVPGKFSTSPIRGAGSPVRAVVAACASSAKWPPSGEHTQVQQHHPTRGSVQVRPASVTARAVLPRERTLPVATSREGLSPVRKAVFSTTAPKTRSPLSPSPTRCIATCQTASVQLSPPRFVRHGGGTLGIPHAASCIDLRTTTGLNDPKLPNARTVLRSISPVPAGGLTPWRNTIASPVGRMACLGVPPPRVAIAAGVRKLVPSASHPHIQGSPVTTEHVASAAAGGATCRAVAPPPRTVNVRSAPRAVQPPHEQSNEYGPAQPLGGASHETSQVPTWASMQVPVRAASPVCRSSLAPPCWLGEEAPQMSVPTTRQWQARTPPSACGRATLPAGVSPLRAAVPPVEGVSTTTRWSVGAVRTSPRSVASPT